MRRNYTRRPRNNVSQVGNFGRLISLGHKLVYPGETLTEHKVQARLQSAPSEVLIGGAYIDVMSFYVPIRLVWSDFPEWILDPDTSVSPNLTSSADDEALVPNNAIDWPEKARDLIYAHFFERDEFPNSFLMLPHPEPDLTTQLQNTALDIEVPVDADFAGSGAGAHVNLSDIEKARYDRKLQTWLDQVSASYPAYLQSMGVNIDDMMLFPEYLGGARKWVYPSRTVDESTGYSVQSYMTDISFTRDRKNAYFAEHGLLVDYIAIRPKLYNGDAETWLRLAEPRDFLIADPVPEEVAQYGDFRAYLYQGESLVASDANAGSVQPSFVYTPSTDNEKIYPNWNGLFTTTNIGTNRHFAVDAKSSSRIKTWIKKPIMVQNSPGATVAHPRSV